MKAVWLGGLNLRALSSESLQSPGLVTQTSILGVNRISRVKGSLDRLRHQTSGLRVSGFGLRIWVSVKKIDDGVGASRDTWRGGESASSQIAARSKSLSSSSPSPSLP